MSKNDFVYFTCLPDIHLGGELVDVLPPRPRAGAVGDPEVLLGDLVPGPQLARERGQAQPRGLQTQRSCDQAVQDTGHPRIHCNIVFRVTLHECFSSYLLFVYVFSFLNRQIFGLVSKN